MDIDQLTLYTQARVIARALDPSPLLALAKGRALDPSIFDEFPPYLWQSEISSDRMDAYYTVMDPDTTLPNYAADAQAGVAVLIGHDSRAAPTGYSLTGTLESGAVTRVLSDAYAIQDAATAPLINKLRAGVIRDVSVGFSTRGATCQCSICQRDMWRDWKCWHIPGVRYKRTDNPEDAVSDPNGALCAGRIVGAHLSEYSLVYDGATPGAAVLQAQRAAEAGRLKPIDIRAIEARYKLHLPDRRVQSQGVTMAKELETDRDASGAAPIDVRALQALVEGSGAPKDATIEQGVRWLTDQVRELTPLAAAGRQYRTDLIDAAEREAVRAFGAEKGAAKRSLLTALALGDIKELTVSWREIGDAALKGGRATNDDTGAPETATVWRKVKIGGGAKA